MTTEPISSEFQAKHEFRFTGLLQRIGIGKPHVRTRLWNTIKRAYAEPQRVYHTAEHIIAMLEMCDSEWFRSYDHYPADLYVDFMEVAIWWHDAVYQTALQNPGISNEGASAAWAYTALCLGGCPEREAHLIHDFILATDHQHKPKNTWAPLVIDLDLAILGADEYHFPLYEAHISAEYGHVPYFDYLRGRTQFLQDFLATRDYIYTTDHFRARFEQQAQENIKGLIEQLQSHLKELQSHGRNTNEEP